MKQQVTKQVKTLEEILQSTAHAELELPSGGIVYPTDSVLSSGVVHMRYMRGEDEEVLLSPAYIREDKALPMLLKRLVLEPDFNPEELTLGDQMFLLLSARVMSIGDDYTIQGMSCSQCGTENQDLIGKVSSIEERPILHKPIQSNINEFSLDLPASGTSITIKSVTVRDEMEMIKMEKRLQQSTGEEFSVSHRTALLIQRIPENTAGLAETPVYSGSLKESPSYVEKLNFVRNLPVKDTQTIRKFLMDINGIPDNIIESECKECGTRQKMPISFGIGFFFPE